MEIVASGFSDWEANATWAAGLGYEYAVWADVDQVLATHYGALREEEELPDRIALILDADGLARVHHDGAVSLGADPSQVLEDCTTLFGAP